MSRSDELVEARLARILRERIRPAIDADVAAVTVDAWAVPGEPVRFADAIEADYTPFEVGTDWGRPWGTTWFRVAGTVPASWRGPIELAVDLGFRRTAPGFQAEALVRRRDGTIVKAIEPLNAWAPIEAAPGEPFVLYLEAASNPDLTNGWTFAPTPLGEPRTAGEELLYRVRRLELVRRDRAVSALERDWSVLFEVMLATADSPRRAGILRALERAADALDPTNLGGTADAARKALAPALAAPAVASAHRAIAVGHAHIDSAWLWPLRETVRKTARTFANVLDLMDRRSDFIFAASAAQHFRWVQEYDPALFERVRARVAEGRFIVVGGMWVESDTNLPGAEALVRQFVHGQRYFRTEFGVSAREGWLPDSFGYSAALPQVLAGSGMENFLTQKISWNETNDFPYSTFWWEGIDGTRVFTHFPPVDTYGSDLSATDLERAQRQNAERGLLDRSIVLFGYGDGGGGPTREMLEAATRKRNLEGSPRVEIDTPAAFFAAARDELADPPVWVGELYLEFHRGTYTSQAKTKVGNRRCEHLLREAELWAATATIRTGTRYPATELRGIWERVLLMQFHDVLPGSSIAWVHRQAEAEYALIAQELEDLISASISAIGAKTGDGVVVNPAPVVVDGVAPFGSGMPTVATSRIAEDDTGWTLESAALRVRVNRFGHVTSFVDVASGRDAVPPGGAGNVLELFRDTPTQWDAWDIDAHYVRTPIAIDSPVQVARAGDGISVRRRIGDSHVRQILRLSPSGVALDIETTVDWHERQRMLKLGFALDVHTTEALSEIQFGHVHRPTHRNTSWDTARFETVAHRWVHVAETGFGVTIANDRVYGHDVTRIPRMGGGTATLARETLLRSPLFPDPDSDHGTHVFRHSVSLGGVRNAIAEGYRLNVPLRTLPTAASIEPIVHLDGSASLIIEAVKLAEDNSGDVIVRVYEAEGGRATARLAPAFPVAAAMWCNLLEDPIPLQPADPCQLTLGPFQIVTLRLTRS